MDRARLGIVQNKDAEHEWKRRRVPELKQRPRDRDPGQKSGRDSGRLPTTEIGLGHKLLKIDVCRRASARCHPPLRSESEFVGGLNLRFFSLSQVAWRRARRRA